MADRGSVVYPVQEHFRLLTSEGTYSCESLRVPPPARPGFAATFMVSAIRGSISDV